MKVNARNLGPIYLLGEYFLSQDIRKNTVGGDVVRPLANLYEDRNKVRQYEENEEYTRERGQT